MCEFQADRTRGFHQHAQGAERIARIFAVQVKDVGQITSLLFLLEPPTRIALWRSGSDCAPISGALVRTCSVKDTVRVVNRHNKGALQDLHDLPGTQAERPGFQVSTNIFLFQGNSRVREFR